jgi:hypothetical protein
MADNGMLVFQNRPTRYCPAGLARPGRLVDGGGASFGSVAMLGSLLAFVVFPTGLRAADPALQSRSATSDPVSRHLIYPGRELNERARSLIARERAPTATEESLIIDHCLIIRDLKVVEDARATGLGPWSLGRLMTSIANAPSTGIDPKDFLEHWLKQCRFNADARRAWKQLSGGTPKMESLPFRLLAIVNRIDLRKNLVLGDQRIGGAGAGELRFVYGLLDEEGKPVDVTVVFEFAVKRSTLGEVRDWARQWYQLRHSAVGTPGFNAALQDLTDQVTRHGADVEAPPNRSALAQLRLNDGDSRSSRAWLFAEFRVDIQNEGYLRRVTTKQTPEGVHNGTQRFNTFLKTFREDILTHKHQVPVRFERNKFLAVDALVESFKPDLFWNGDNLPAELLEARHLVSLNTCNSCHTRETGTSFFHVRNRKQKEVAELSKFLTGTDWIDDPAGQKEDGEPSKIKRRKFGDLQIRAADLRNLVELGQAYEELRVPLNAVH